MIRIFLPLICAALGFAAASCTQSQEPLASATEAPPSPHPTSHGAASVAMAAPPDARQPNGAGQSAPDTDPAASAAPSPPATPPSQAVSDQTLSSDELSKPATSQTTPDANPNTPASARAERRASRLIGMPVVAADGNALGEVKDIIFDRQGHATHVVISYGNGARASSGGVPNDGAAAHPSDSKFTAMPWDAAMASIKAGHLRLDDAQLQGAPSFTRDTWPDLDDPAWSDTTDAYWRKAVQAAIAAHPGAPIDSTSRQRERPPRDGS